MCQKVKIFCPSFSESFGFSFYFFENPYKLQQVSVFSRKVKNLFINTTLLHFQWCLVQKSGRKILFEIYQVHHFVTVFLNINFKRKWVFRSTTICRKCKFKGSQMKIHQTILGKRLQTNSED